MNDGILSHRREISSMTYPFSIGDAVEKEHGYKWPGIIVSVFTTLDGKTRIVVECTVNEVRGALHIYAPEQLRHLE